MDKFKSIFASRTIITNFVTAFAGVAVLWGFNLTPEQQLGVVTAIVTIGPALSSFFRATATKQIVGTPAKAAEKNEAATTALGIASTTRSMSDKRYSGLLVLLAIMPLLGGCVTASPSGTIAVTSGVILTAADTKIQKASQQISQYCHVLRFATGAASFFVQKPQHQVYLDRAASVVATYCDNPPADVYGALNLLATAYRNIMAVPAVKVAVSEASLTVK